MRNLFWGLLGLALALLSTAVSSTGPPLSAVASHETMLLSAETPATNADGTIAQANGLYQQEGAATGVFNGAAPLDTTETVALLMNDPPSGYSDTGRVRIDTPAVAEPLYAFTVPRRESDFSVVRLN